MSEIFVYIFVFVCMWLMNFFFVSRLSEKQQKKQQQQHTYEWSQLDHAFTIYKYMKRDTVKDK